MANGGSVTDSLDFGDMGTAEPASEIMRRKQQMAEAPKEFVKEAQQTSQEIDQTIRSKAALEEMRIQTARMKEGMKYRQANFDEGLKLQRQLEGIDSNAKKNLFDSQIQFQRDASGRKLLSERQISDWMIQKGASEEDFRNFELRGEQLHSRRLQLLQAAYNKIQQAEKQAYQMGATETSRQTQMIIAEKKAEMEKKLAKAKQKSANRSAIITGAFTVAGAVAGGLAGAATGTPQGAMLGANMGASAGGGLGTAVAGATN